jgi:hypothetical protein
MADRSLTGYAIRIGIFVLSVVMVWFMLGRPELYPLWTVGLIGALGAVSVLSLFRYVSD